jgi:hypothetical protein
MADKSTRIILEGVDRTKAAVDSAKGNFGQLNSVVNTLNGTLGRLLPFLGAATFTAFVKGGIDTLDMLHDLQDRTGVAAETLAGFQLVAAQSDTSLEALGKGINKLSVYMAENGDAAKKMGIDAKDPAEAFLQLSDVLSNIENVQQRNAVANKFLGKSYQELLPALMQGSAELREQIRLGREYSGVTAQGVIEAAKFNDNLDELAVNAEGLKTATANAILPSLNQIIAKFLEASKETNTFTGAFRALIEAGEIALFGSESEQKQNRFDSLQKSIAVAGKELEQLEDQMKSFGAGKNALDPGSEGASRESDKVLADRFYKKRAEIYAQSLELQQLARDLNRNVNVPGNAKDAKAADFLDTSKAPKVNTEQATEAARQYATLYGEFTKVLDGTQNLSKAEQTLADIQAGRFGDLLDWQQEQLANLAREVKAKEELKVFEEGDRLAQETEIDLINEQLEAEQRLNDQRLLAEDAYDKTLEQIQKQNEELQFQLSIQNLSETAMQDAIDARNVEIQLQETLNALAEQGLGLTEAEIEALREKYGELAKLNRKLDDQKSTSKEIGLTFKSAFEDAVVGGKKFSDVLKGIEQDIIRIITRKAVTEPLTEGVGNIFGSFDWGSLFSSFFANADGNAFNQYGVMPFAKGGVIDSATPFMFANGGRLGVMGEAGPEAILPLRRGANGQLGVQTDGSAKGGNVIVQIFGGGKDKPEVDQRTDGNGNEIISVMLDTVRGEMIKDVRSEGPFAQAMQGQYGLNRAAGAM